MHTPVGSLPTSRVALFAAHPQGETSLAAALRISPDVDDDVGSGRLFTVFPTGSEEAAGGTPDLLTLGSLKAGTGPETVVVVTGLECDCMAHTGRRYGVDAVHTTTITTRNTTIEQ